MRTIIKIEKEDIVTSRMGCNVEVQIDEKTSLIFTPEALDELSNDYSEIKKELIAQRDLNPVKDVNQLEIPFPKEVDVNTLYKEL